MAIAWVASTGGEQVILGGSSSIVQAASTSVTTGNSIVVFVMTIDTSGYKTLSGVADTAGNTYAICGSRYQNLYAGTYYLNVECWAALNITGHAANYVTASFSATDAGSMMILGSWSGMATSSAYDTGYDPAGNVDSASVYTTTADTTAENNELVIGAFFPLASDSHTRSSSSPSVLRYAGTNGLRCIADNAAASAGSFAVSVASTTDNDNFCLARAFKQVSASNPTVTISETLSFAEALD